MQDRADDQPNEILNSDQRARRLPRRLSAYNLVLFGLVILLGGFRLQQIGSHFIQNLSQPTTYYQYDFGAYYVAAASLNIDSTQSIYDRQVLESAAEISGMRTGFSEYIYPPFFAVLLSPLARLPQLIAILIWAIFNLIWLGLSVFLLLKTAGINISPLKIGLLVAFLLIFPPVYHTILIFGQVNLLLLFLFSVTLYATRQRETAYWQILAGIALGIGIGIKLFFAILVIYYLFYNRRRVAISALITFIATVGIGVLGAGYANTHSYFTDIVFDVNQIDKTFWVNLSIEPSIKRFFTSGSYDYQLASMPEPATAVFQPPIHSAAIGKTVAFVARVLFALYTGGYFIADWLTKKRQEAGFHDLLRITFLLISVVLFLPLGWFSTHVLVIAPLIFLYAYLNSKSIPAGYFVSFTLLVYLLLLVNDSFFYLDFLLQRPINTTILSLGFIAILSIWAMLGLILFNQLSPPIKPSLYRYPEQLMQWKPANLRQSFVELLPLISILGLALITRFIAMYGKGLWYDELQSVTHASLPIPDLLSSVRMYDPHPPLYYIQLHYWMKLGTSDLWIKSNSVLTSLIAIASLYFLGRKVFNHRTAILAALIFAIAPYAVNYGSEARNYALWMLLVIWAYQLNNRLLLSSRKFVPAVGLFGVTVAFLYLHGISFLILPALYIHALILLLRRETKLTQMVAWIGVQLLIILAYIPWLQRAWTIGNVTPAVVPGFEDIITTLYIHLLGYCSTCPVWLQTVAITAWLAVCVVVVVRCPASRIAILAYTFTPALATITISYLMRPIWLFRGLGLLVPFMLLTIAVWLDRLLDHTGWRRTAAIGITALTLGIFSLALYHQTRTLVYPWDFKSAAQFVKSNAQPGEVVYLVHERIFWCWNWYFLGPGQINPIQTDYSTQTETGVKIISKPAWIDPPQDKGYWQVYRDFDRPPIDTSELDKQAWNFEDLIVEYIPPQPVQ